jgi:NTE family protein
LHHGLKVRGVTKFAQAGHCHCKRDPHNGASIFPKNKGPAVKNSAWGAVLSAAMLAGCASTATTVATPAVAPAPPKVALVLGGGAARGFAHVGVIKVLQGHGIEPDLVVGTSAGCVAGSFYAAGYSGFDMQELAFGLDRTMVADWSPWGRGLIKGEALQNYVDDAVHHVTMEHLKRRFACVAVKLRRR